MSNFRHGQACNGRVTRIHNIWRGILKRVDAKSGEAAAKYSDRGISICQEWRRFEVFRDWAIANGYRDDLTIERRNNDGNYEPGNCSWIPMALQARNRRNSHRITALGITATFAEWEERTGIAQTTICARIRLGWPSERAVSQPVRRKVA